jgi:hypothetical protein
MQMTSGDARPRPCRALRRRLIGATSSSVLSRPDADASKERVVDLWLHDRPANTRTSLRTGLHSLTALSLTAQAALSRPRRPPGLRRPSDWLGRDPPAHRLGIKVLVTAGFKMGLGAALRRPGLCRSVPSAAGSKKSSLSGFSRRGEGGGRQRGYRGTYALGPGLTISGKFKRQHLAAAVISPDRHSLYTAGASSGWVADLGRPAVLVAVKETDRRSAASAQAGL